MKFLADENIKLRVTKWLRKNGHDVILTPKGLPDKAVAELAKRQTRVLLTHDSDFADSEKFPPSQYCGIIWLSLKFPTLERIVDSLEYLLSNLSSKDIDGKLIAVSDVRDFKIGSPE